MGGELAAGKAACSSALYPGHNGIEFAVFGTAFHSFLVSEPTPELAAETAAFRSSLDTSGLLPELAAQMAASRSTGSLAELAAKMAASGSIGWLHGFAAKMAASLSPLCPYCKVGHSAL
jgi:hypothetical protein